MNSIKDWMIHPSYVSIVVPRRIAVKIGCAEDIPRPRVSKPKMIYGGLSGRSRPEANRIADKPAPDSRSPQTPNPIARPRLIGRKIARAKPPSNPKIAAMIGASNTYDEPLSKAFWMTNA